MASITIDSTNSIVTAVAKLSLCSSNIV